MSGPYACKAAGLGSIIARKASWPRARCCCGSEADASEQVAGEGFIELSVLSVESDKTYFVATDLPIAFRGARGGR